MFELSIHWAPGGGYVLWDQQAGREITADGFPFSTYEDAEAYATTELSATII